MPSLKSKKGARQRWQLRNVRHNPPRVGRIYAGSACVHERAALQVGPLKLVVQANQGILDVRFGGEHITTSRSTGRKGRTLRAEAHEIIFRKH